MGEINREEEERKGIIAINVDLSCDMRCESLSLIHI